MKLIVGLGNPGRKYKKTRHNVGFWVLDEYLLKEKWNNKFESEYIEKNISGEKIMFIKPQTYMNLSGNSVKKFIEYYKIPVENILVIQDDLDLSIGDSRFKNNSTSGGHNGINSIIENLGSKDFFRLKIGIGAEYKTETSEFVLSNFSKKEKEIIKGNLFSYFNVIDEFIQK